MISKEFDTLREAISAEILYCIGYDEIGFYNVFTVSLK